VDDEEYHQEMFGLIDYLKIKDIIIPGTVKTTKLPGRRSIYDPDKVFQKGNFRSARIHGWKRPVVTTDVGSCRDLIEGDVGDNFG